MCDSAMTFDRERTSAENENRANQFVGDASPIRLGSEVTVLGMETGPLPVNTKRPGAR
jgi:hypothetical protein